MRTERINLEQNTINTAFLRAKDNSGAQSWELKKQLYIGRSPDNDVVIADPFISRKHAKIEWISPHFYLIDLGSQNGTFLNRSQITKAILNEGDLICIGNRQYSFSYLEENPKNWLTSKNQNYQKQLLSLPKVAKTELPVLVLGESGSGKEIISRYIHEQSSRKGQAFVSINCSALSSNVIESELFGHKKGSFTDAHNNRKGAFESARGGTLVLDEIGDLPLDLQPKLLRALENKEIRPLGSDITIKTDVRIIASTHKNLKQMVMKGEFRKDLYFRLNIVPITVPRLANRMEDFEDLLYSFAKEMRVSFTHQAIQEMKKHSWPGNIRELKNVISRASALFNRQERVTHEDLHLLIESFEPNYSLKKENNLPLIKEIECELIQTRLIANGGNQRKTAIDLGIPKSTLNDRIKKYNINIKSLIKASQ